MTDRTFDYRPRLDERNRAYRISTADPELLNRSRYWVPGPVLDQGREGACVGFGCTGEAMASPVRVRMDRWATYGQAPVGNEAALGVYRRAKEIDEWEGVDYEGTSVRAGMLVGRERGWWSGFRWAFNMLELRAALEEGPVVIGVDWYSGMYETDGGSLFPVGQVVGGHCILVTGYSPRRKVGSITSPAFRLRNSWSADWGVNGSAYIAADNLDKILFQAGGEAAVPVGRAL